MKKRIKFKFILMRHWGIIYMLPSIEVSMTYNMLTFIISWWIFQFDILLYYRLPDWFVKYIWGGFFQLDFIDWIKAKTTQKEENL